MARLLRRAAEVAGLMAVAFVAVFVLVRVLPGDPVARLAVQPGVGAAELAQIRADLGLDRPVSVQLAAYLGGMVRGDLGHSLVTGQPVAAEIAARLPATLALAGAAFGLALVLGVGGGAAAALAGGRVAAAAGTLAAVCGAVPTFASGLFLIHIFYDRLGIAPAPFGAGAGQIVLPALAMALFAFGPILRITLGALRDALGSGAIEGGRALGLSAGQNAANALRLVAGPVAAVAAPTLAYLIGAGGVIERVFAWPGVGGYALEAALAADHAPVQGVVLVLAGCIAILGGAAGWIARRLDPRLGDG
jgi:peptide/nickel transport system permease protein